MVKRVPLSKKTRFEVLKRDSFKCQYCGECAPTVLLHVDHIKPVVEGGTNDVINLITSCEGCNLGKGARELSDDTAIIKSRTQLEALQERREQLEMMMEWQTGLVDLQKESTRQVCDFWTAQSGLELTPTGIDGFAKLIKKYGVAEVIEGINISQKYLVRGPDGEYTRESGAASLDKLGGILHLRSQAGGADLAPLYRLRNFAVSKFPYDSWAPITLFNLMCSLTKFGWLESELEEYIELCGSWEELIDQFKLWVKTAKNAAASKKAS